MQPTWWDMYVSKDDSSQQNAQAELPVSSSIPNSNDGTKQQFSNSQQPSSKDSQASAKAAPQAKSLQKFASAMQASSPWIDPTAAGSKRPPSRYEHAAQIVGRTLFVIGGNCSKSFAQPSLRKLVLRNNAVWTTLYHSMHEQIAFCCSLTPPDQCLMLCPACYALPLTGPAVIVQQSLTASCSIRQHSICTRIAPDLPVSHQGALGLLAQVAIIVQVGGT